MGSSYHEYAPPAVLRSAVACLWERAVDGAHVQRVVPDGCLDLIWLSERELVIAGPDTGPRQVALAPAARSSAIRLRPGAAGAFLGIPASEIRDQHRPAAAVIGDAAARRLEETLAGATPSERLNVLAEFVDSRAVAPDPLTSAAAAALAQPAARVREVARDLGVSERELHRRIVTAVGYGPKMLARVARLRRLVVLRGGSLASRALDAGYASQSHMSDEVRRLTGLTPVRFLEDASPTRA